MPYYITKLTHKEKKITLDDILFDVIDEKTLKNMKYNTNISATKTYYSESNYSYKLSKKVGSDIYDKTKELERFYERYKHLDIFFDDEYDYELQQEIKERLKRELGIWDNTDDELEAATKSEMEKIGKKFNPNYYTFYVPKKTRGYRRIDAPQPELAEALRQLKTIIESMMNYNTYHTAAYAYIPNRSRVDLVKKLQANKTRWLLKLDFSNFFGSIDYEFLMRQLRKIYPFSEMVKCKWGEDVLGKCMRLCFLNGVLPQGTPMSPLLTNILMIPLDFKISNALAKRAKEITEFDKDDGESNYRLIYTRYADDIYIGGHRGFRYNPVVKFIQKIIDEEQAPMVLNKEKTRYCSNAGSNWVLGLMYNQEMEITLGHKKKKQIQAMINNFCMDIKNQNNLEEWTPHDMQVALGNIAYLRSIEPEYCKTMMDKYDKKFGYNVEEKMKDRAYGEF